MSSIMELRDVTRCFDSNTVLDHVSIKVEQGSFTALLGASGCGKSTSLRIMAGLDRPTSGEVLLNGRDVRGQNAYERNVAMVFQSYALYPHLTVAQNIALPLTMRHLSNLGRMPLLGSFVPGATEARRTIMNKVVDAAKSLGLEELLDRKPGSLSGGQKQRVALGRALVRDPALFLLDEPLSNLDARLRIRMRSEISSLHRLTGKAFVYVTHDQTEAMAMADQIVVMIGGQVAQAGSPRDLYERPVHRDVAAFIGHNAINFLEPGDGINAGDSIVGLRPEDLTPNTAGSLSAKLEASEYLGSEIMLSLRSRRGTEFRAIAPGDYIVPTIGSDIRLAYEPQRVHLFDAVTGKRKSGVKHEAVT
ncbi:ABC transporter ATP-binding protein [Marinomonas foliarum]|jgi:multiple sugar transport system ATP-binding protein|uniref:ABC transporter ATP-binding protein n=1 Tax=Marinomonas foliarum TaxID=491950 RepID=A0ABX7IU81_9GAMM|nr:ABC transporter ATP-binding protein [Marinomonas foliarum]QRV25631.1 ABC transporter ATP-binding protein [Marinomonas foliarum]